MIRDYFLTSRWQWLEREASDHRAPYPENPYAGEFQWVTEHIMRLVEERPFAPGIKVRDDRPSSAAPVPIRSPCQPLYAGGGA